MGTTTMEKVGLQTVSVPVLGLGTYQSPPGVVGQAVEWALEAGYRYFDCAIVYGNEAEIGDAINKWIKEGRVDRKDLFITTKLPLFALRPELVEDYCDKSLSNLGLDYLDQYLIHAPFGVKKRSDDWTPGDGFPWAVNSQGKARSIGVSNFGSKQVETISAVAKVPIATNQVELHLYCQQKRLASTCSRLGIKLTCYAPLGSPGREITQNKKDIARIMDDQTVLRIAAQHGKTPAQVLMRHLIQSGHIVIPKSVSQHRLKENISVFDFKLTKVEMGQLELLDQNKRTFDLGFLNGDMDPRKLPTFPEDMFD